MDIKIDKDRTKRGNVISLTKLPTLHTPPALDHQNYAQNEPKMGVGSGVGNGKSESTDPTPEKGENHAQNDVERRDVGNVGKIEKS